MLFRIMCALLLLMCTGCSQMKELAQDFYDASEEYPPAPRNLDASPDETGLLLVYAEMLEKGLLWDHDVNLDAVSIVRVDDPDNLIIVSDFSYKLVVFHGLEPGVYLMHSLIGSKEEEDEAGNKETIHVERLIHDLPDVSVTIEAGAAVYVGKVTCMNDSYLGENWMLSVDRSAEHEIHAWEELHSRYAKSVWAPRIAEKLLQTRSGAPQPD